MFRSIRLWSCSGSLSKSARMPRSPCGVSRRKSASSATVCSVRFPSRSACKSRSSAAWFPDSTSACINRSSIFKELSDLGSQWLEALRRVVGRLQYWLFISGVVMLTPAQVIPFLKDERAWVRDHAMDYLRDSHDPAPATADDLWCALDANDDEDERFQFYLSLADFPH